MAWGWGLCSKQITFAISGEHSASENVIRCFLYSVHIVWIFNWDMIIIFIDNLSKYVQVILSCSPKAEPFPSLVSSFLGPFFLGSLLPRETLSHSFFIHMKEAIQSLSQALIELTLLFLLLKHMINHNSWIVI